MMLTASFTHICSFLLLLLRPIQKLIKELPSLVPSDESKITHGAQARLNSANARADSPCSLDSLSSNNSQTGLRQQHGVSTAEMTGKQAQRKDSNRAEKSTSTIGKSPGEVAFFKLLHAELKKAVRFFDRASEEFTIREERVREGIEIMRQPNSIMVNEKWTLMGKSIYHLYKDLLLLETFAIMTYCSFSKILKKHDKNTGYGTRTAFMTNIVNKANFTHYPKLLEMINRCERLYGEVSENLLREGKEGLYEDERLFINMIHRLNSQVLGSEDGVIAARKDSPRRPVSKLSPSEKNESQATTALRSIVEENEQAQKVGDKTNVADDDSDDGNTPPSSPKRRAVSRDIELSRPTKRPRTACAAVKKR